MPPGWFLEVRAYLYGMAATGFICRDVVTRCSCHGDGRRLYAATASYPPGPHHHIHITCCAGCEWAAFDTTTTHITSRQHGMHVRLCPAYWSSSCTHLHQSECCSHSEIKYFPLNICSRFLSCAVFANLLKILLYFFSYNLAFRPS